MSARMMITSLCLLLSIVADSNEDYQGLRVEGCMTSWVRHSAISNPSDFEEDEEAYRIVVKVCQRLRTTSTLLRWITLPWSSYIICHQKRRWG